MSITAGEGVNGGHSWRLTFPQRNQADLNFSGGECQ